MRILHLSLGWWLVSHVAKKIKRVLTCTCSQTGRCRQTRRLVTTPLPPSSQRWEGANWRSDSAFWRASKKLLTCRLGLESTCQERSSSTWSHRSSTRPGTRIDRKRSKRYLVNVQDWHLPAALPPWAADQRKGGRGEQLRQGPLHHRQGLWDVFLFIDMSLRDKIIKGPSHYWGGLGFINNLSDFLIYGLQEVVDLVLDRIRKLADACSGLQV